MATSMQALLREIFLPSPWVLIFSLETVDVPDLEGSEPALAPRVRMVDGAMITKW